MYIIDRLSIYWTTVNIVLFTRIEFKHNFSKANTQKNSIFTQFSNLILRVKLKDTVQYGANTFRVGETVQYGANTFRVGETVLVVKTTDLGNYFIIGTTYL